MGCKMSFVLESKLDDALFKLDTDKVKVAIAVVQSGKHWLLGLSSSTDDRLHKWCFPGGHINSGESISHAAEREAREETGIRVRVEAKPVILPSKPHVIFLHCTASKDASLKPNKEFIALGWFTIRDMKGLKLYPNVLQVIDQMERKR